MRNERFMMLRIIVCLLCCVMQADRMLEEGISCPLLKPVVAREVEHTQKSVCVKKKNPVRLLYFPKEHEFYSATYDVEGYKIGGVYRTRTGPKVGKAAVPLLYFLQQEVLKGYILKPGHSEPKITNTDFCVQDARLKDYDRKEFYSLALDCFVTEVCPILSQKGRAEFDLDGQGLTGDRIKRSLPRRIYKRFCWQVLPAGQAVDVLQNHKKKQDVFLIVDGVGILWGHQKLCLCQGVNKDSDRNLLEFKMRQVMDAMCAKYPASQEDHAKTLWSAP